MFGIVSQLESDDIIDKNRKRLLKKWQRVFIYIMGIIGGYGILTLLDALILHLANLTNNQRFINFASKGGLPRFSSEVNFDINMLKWAIPLIIAGVILALLYNSFNLITLKLSEKIKDKRILSCVIAGVCVAIAGWLLPNSIFSGEHQLGDLINNWENEVALILLLTALCKILLTNICVNFGWRGGTIFPIMFSAASAGYALALFIGIDGAFAAALVISAMYGYISRKPLATAAILLLCFPIIYVIPILATSFIVSKIPTPFKECN